MRNDGGGNDDGDDADLPLYDPETQLTSISWYLAVMLFCTVDWSTLKFYNLAHLKTKKLVAYEFVFVHVIELFHLLSKMKDGIA